MSVPSPTVQTARGGEGVDNIDGLLSRMPERDWSSHRCDVEGEPEAAAPSAFLKRGGSSFPRIDILAYGLLVLLGSLTWASHGGPCLAAKQGPGVLLCMPNRTCSMVSAFCDGRHTGVLLCMPNRTRCPTLHAQ
jgi:hypothetical protein